MKITPKLSEKIEMVLREYVMNPETLWDNSEKTVNLRKIAAELNVLPLLPDWTGGFGINRDGEIILFNYEKPYEAKVEENQRIINLVLFEGITERFPELSELLPVRGADSKDCSFCDGTGIEPLSQIIPNIGCYCGGLGWLPKDDVSEITISNLDEFLPDGIDKK